MSFAVVDLQPAMVPVLETERLVLRGHTTEDFGDCLGMWSDERVTRYIGGKPSTPEEVWSRILRYRGHWSLLGFGYWVVRERATGVFVGEVGFADFRREAPLLAGAPEAGWSLSPHAQGKGYGTEAVRAAIRWADGHFGAIRTVCMIDPPNAPSIRLAERCGYVVFDKSDYKGQPALFFERRPSAGLNA